MNLLNLVMIGFIATAAADLWQQAVKRLAGFPIPNWELIGRWVALLPRGTVIHTSIAAAPAVEGEGAIGWIFHYAVGIAYAACFVAILGLVPGSASGLAVALAFAGVTLAAPWFFLQPALGLGLMGRRAPNQKELLFVTITTHFVFGLGLYAGLNAVVPR